MVEQLGKSSEKVLRLLQIAQIQHTYVNVLFTGGGDRSLVTNYRPVSLTSVVCKQMDHVIASYLRQVWNKNNWLYKGQHGFRPGYSCKSQVITVCQDIADSLDN